MASLPQPIVYLIHLARDAESAGWLRDFLGQHEIHSRSVEDDLAKVPLGSHLPTEREKIRRTIRDADAVLVLVTPRMELARDVGDLAKDVHEALEAKRTIVPVFLGQVRDPLPPELSVLYEFRRVEVRQVSPGEAALLTLVAALKSLQAPDSGSLAPAPLPKRPATHPAANVSLTRVELRNIRCFESLDLDLTTEDGPARFVMILGDNATGKSTLLRSIALGLCGESDTSALIKQLPGSFVRQGAKEGSIRLELQNGVSDKKLAVTTRILRGGTSEEAVRKETRPKAFPWNDLFVCAYGTNRSRQATASYDSYSLHQAVLPLFDDDALLQNPEVVLLRQEPRLRAEIERQLLRVLMLDGDEHAVTYPQSGPEIHGPWGDQPVRTLSDGYRSTAQWILDLLGWAIYARRFQSGREIGGLLVIDEIEQHLHPRWQRHIVQRLHQLLPATQIFASTHTPLTAVGVADIAESALAVRLEDRGRGGFEAVRLDPATFDGLRADQVLASEAFGLYTSRNPGSEDEVDRYADLLGREARTPEEEEELGKLGTKLESRLQIGESQTEREVANAVEKALKERALGIDPRSLDLEVRKQLREIFDADEADGDGAE